MRYKNTRTESMRTRKWDRLTKYLSEKDLEPIIKDYEVKPRERYSWTWIIKRAPFTWKKYAIYTRPEKPKKEVKPVRYSYFDVLCNQLHYRKDYWQEIKRHFK